MSGNIAVDVVRTVTHLADANLKVAEKNLRKASLRVAESLWMLAYAYQLTGSHETAEPLLVRCTELVGRLFGQDSWERFFALKDLLWAYSTLGRADDRESIVKEMDEAGHELDGNEEFLLEHDAVIDSLTDLAVACLDRGDSLGTRQAFVLATVALYRICGYRTEAPVRLLELPRLRFLMKSLGIDRQEWQRLVQLAREMNLDFERFIKAIHEEGLFIPADYDPDPAASGEAA